jgi:hypothetical protein
MAKRLHTHRNKIEEENDGENEKKNCHHKLVLLSIKRCQ